MLRKMNERTRKAASAKAIIIAGIALILIICVGAGVFFFGQRASSKEDASSAAEPITFPKAISGGDIVVNGMFPSDALNPDCNWEEGEDIATVELVNNSREHITLADITVISASGEELSFRVEELPPGATVWAFETSNISLKSGFECSGIKSNLKKTEYSLMSDVFSVNESGISVSFSNLTGSEISGCEAAFHCLLDDIFYGGRAFTADIAAVPSGGSVTLSVAECILGDAKTVRVSRK